MIRLFLERIIKPKEYACNTNCFTECKSLYDNKWREVPRVHLINDVKPQNRNKYANKQDDKNVAQSFFISCQCDSLEALFIHVVKHYLFTFLVSLDINRMLHNYPLKTLEPED